MELYFDSAALEPLLRNFYSIVGLRIGIFHPDGRCMLVYPQDECSFCARIKGDARFRARCAACDQEALAHAMSGELWVYRCHAGLYEAVSPILCGGKPVAALMIGQAASCAPAHQAQQDVCERIKDHPALYALLDSFASMPKRTEEQLRACAQIMAACAGYIYLNGLIRPQESPLSLRLRTYLEANYARSITLSDMALTLGVGVTSLCSAVRRACGTTPHAMLCALRIEHACELLSQTDQPIREVAAAVGMADYNYFSRVFRRSTGLSPSAFRKRISGTPPASRP